MFPIVWQRFSLWYFKTVKHLFHYFLRNTMFCGTLRFRRTLLRNIGLARCVFSVLRELPMFLISTDLCGFVRKIRGSNSVWFQAYFNIKIFYILTQNVFVCSLWSRNKQGVSPGHGVVGVATCYGLDGRGSNSCRGETFHTHPKI
jgi:hypothetical protein